MKNIFVFLASFCLSLGVFAQSTFTIKQDTRIELTQIAWYLAGYEEYTPSNNYRYVNAVDAYYENYKSLPLIAYLQELNKEHQFHRSVIQLSALQLKIDKKGVHFQTTNPELEKKLYHYFPKKQHQKYVRLLNQFYKETDSEHFFTSNQAIFAKSQAMYNKRIAQQIDIPTYEKMFGTEFGNRTIFLQVGGYEMYKSIPFVEINGVLQPAYLKLEDTYSKIYGLYRSIAWDMPYTELIMRSFVLSKSQAYDSEVKSSSQFLDSKLHDTYASMGLSASNLWNEWIVKVSTQLYRKLHHNHEESGVDSDRLLGFIWAQRTNFFLDNYINNPKSYSTFYDFIPQLVAYYNYLPQNFDQLIEETSRKPCITAIFPMPGTLLNLNQDSVEISFTFSEPMCQILPSCAFISEKFDILTLSNSLPVNYSWKDSYTFVIKIPASEMKKYEVNKVELPHDFFMNLNGQTLQEDFTAAYLLNL